MFIKKKDFEELKNRVEKLEDKIAVFEFEKENPNGIKLERIFIRRLYDCYHEERIRYVNHGKVKILSLEAFDHFGIYDWEILENNIIKQSSVFDGRKIEKFYELDKNNDKLVEVMFKEKSTTKKGGKK